MKNPFKKSSGTATSGSATSSDRSATPQETAGSEAYYAALGTGMSDSEVAQILAESGTEGLAAEIDRRTPSAENED